MLALLVALIALAAPATACGLSRPVTPEPWRPRGWGNILTCLFEANELAGRDGLVGGLLSEVGPLAVGWKDARRLVVDWSADMDDWVVSCRGRTEGEV